MSTAITIRIIDPADKAWLRQEAQRLRVSVAEVVRRLVHEERIKSEGRQNPAEAFAKYFGKEHGIDLQLPRRSHKPLTFPSDDEE